MLTNTRHAVPTLGRLASRRFLLLDSELPVDQARQLLTSLRPEHVVVPLPGGDEHYAVEIADLVRLRLSRAKPAALLGQVLELSKLEPVPIRRPYEEAAGAPDLCLLLEDGVLVGVFDVDRPNDGPLRGGTLRRYLAAEHPSVATVGELLSVLVFLESVPWTRASRTEVELPDGAQVDVFLRCSPELEIEGPREASFTISEGDVEPPPHRFRLRAIEPGTARVELSAYCGNACVGSLTEALRVDAEPLRAGTATPRHGSVRLFPPPATRPDLSLLILETGTSRDRGLHFRLESEGLDRKRRDFFIGPLTEPATAYLTQLFQAFEAGEDAEDPETLRAVLEQRGAYLFETLLPPELRELLRREQERISSVQILSDEYWIPWELCCLPAPPGNGKESRFFCEAFALGRWHQSQAPCSRLGAGGPIGLVVPDDTTLPKATQEKQDLLILAAPPFAAEEIQALYVPLIEALGSGRYGGFHFTGHGSIARDAGAGAEIDLEKMRFTPRDLSGSVANLRERRPFVFFNACQVGRQGQGLAGPDGWAAAFLRAGAGAFLGTYWSVSDDVARCFARHVYEKLFAGETIGEAVRHARCRVRDDFPESATWLAYTLYADPLAKLGSAEARAEWSAA